MRVLLLSLFLACWIVPLASADRETALFHAQRGDKSLQAKSWEEAEQHYRRALEEDPTFLPARYGLGEALIGAGRRAPGVEELRRFNDEAGALSDLPAAWNTLLVKARKRLVEIDALGSELGRLLSDHVDALVAFAKRWKDKDAEVAAQALEGALRIRPGDEGATALLAAVRKAQAPPEPLFNGKDVSGWDMNPEVWTVEDGILRSRPPVGGSVLARTDAKVSGDYDVRVEASFEPTGAVPFFGLAAALLDEWDKVVIGSIREDLVFWDYPGSKEYREIWAAPRTALKPPMDVRQFNVYELRFRHDTITAVLNGKEVGSYPRPANRASGFVGLHVQQGTASIRRVELVRR